METPAAAGTRFTCSFFIFFFGTASVLLSDSERLLTDLRCCLRSRDPGEIHFYLARHIHACRHTDARTLHTKPHTETRIPTYTKPHAHAKPHTETQV